MLWVDKPSGYCNADVTADELLSAPSPQSGRFSWVNANWLIWCVSALSQWYHFQPVLEAFFWGCACVSSFFLFSFKTIFQCFFLILVVQISAN